MPEWLRVLLPLVALTATAWWLYSRHRRQDSRLLRKIDCAKHGRKTGQTDEVLRQIYDLIDKNIAADNPAAAYQAVDMLKAAFGEGLMRKNEPALLASVIIMAVRKKQIDIASAALDAYRQMLRHSSAAQAGDAAESLGIITAVIMREKQVFLAAKAADIILEALDRNASDATVVAAFMPTLKTIGLLAIRRKDNGLFREINGRLAVLARNLPAEGFGGQLLSVGGAWLHRIVKNNDLSMFLILAELVALLPKTGVTDNEFYNMVKEWSELAGTASLNPNSEITWQIIRLNLDIAREKENKPLWEAAVNGAGQTVRLAMSRRGAQEAFAVLQPLLVSGRNLLSQELKFGDHQTGETFRSYALFYVVRECVAIAEYIARQDMLKTAADIIGDFNKYWGRQEDASPKADKRFCQLLVAYWARNSRKAKKIAVSEDLANPPVLSEADKEKLGFLQ